MGSSKFTISRFAYFLLAGIWVFSIGIIAFSHFFIGPVSPKFSTGWFIYAGMFWMAPLIIVTASTWGMFQQIHTIIDDDKIRQPNLVSGNIVIEWKDITRVAKEGNGRLRFYTNEKQVVISQYLFSKPEEFYNFIHQKVSSEKFL